MDSLELDDLVWKLPRSLTLTWPSLEKATAQFPTLIQTPISLDPAGSEGALIGNTKVPSLRDTRWSPTLECDVEWDVEWLVDVDLLVDLLVDREVDVEVLVVVAFVVVLLVVVLVEVGRGGRVVMTVVTEVLVVLVLVLDGAEVVVLGGVDTGGEGGLAWSQPDPNSGWQPLEQ
ncbi:hypothetical protein F4810DRAFT_705621 [Camillea tinctor]|nr:hypothetical protein F4810DRAFT_705621 [Camillea tinctor]